MKIAVLSRNPRLYSTRRLVEAGTQRGHEMVVIDTLRAYMNIASHKPQIHYRGKPLEGFDAVIPRIGASVTFYGCAVLRQFERVRALLEPEGLFAPERKRPLPASPARLALLTFNCLAAPIALAQQPMQLDAMQISGAPLSEIEAAQEALKQVPGTTNLVDMDKANAEFPPFPPFPPFSPVPFSPCITAWAALPGTSSTPSTASPPP